MRGWLAFVALLTIVGLMANAQCLARCIASAPVPAADHNDSPCHHSPHSQEKNRGSQCSSSHHVESLAKAAPAPVVPAIEDAATATAGLGQAVAVFSSQSECLNDRVLPPDKRLFLAISVLRL